MRKTTRPSDSSTSILVTTHDDPDGKQQEDDDAVPARPGAARPAPRAIPASMAARNTHVAPESKSAGHEATGWSRGTRLALGAGAAILVGLGVAVALDPPTWSDSPTPSMQAGTAPRPPAPVAENPQAVVLAGMDASCRQLVSVVAAALGAQTEDWVRSVQLRPGQTLDEAIRERLSAARATMVRTRYTDPKLDEVLADLDSALSQAAADPCSS